MENKNTFGNYIYNIWVVAASYCTVWMLSSHYAATMSALPYSVRSSGVGSAVGLGVTFVLPVIIARYIVRTLNLHPFLLAASGSMIGSCSAVFITVIMGDQLPFSGKYGFLFIAFCTVAGHIFSRLHFGWRTWKDGYLGETEIKQCILNGICYGCSFVCIIESFYRSFFPVATQRLSEASLFIPSIAFITIIYYIIHTRVQGIIREQHEKREAEYREFCEEWVRKQREKEEKERQENIRREQARREQARAERERYERAERERYERARQEQRTSSNDTTARQTRNSFFSGCTNASDLKRRYREMCKLYHPDNSPGHEEEFKAMNAEYARLKYRMSA